MNPVLIQLVAEQLPAVIAGVKALFSKRSPNAPTPTDAEIEAVFYDTVAQSLAADAAWLSAHPPSGA